MVWGQRNLAFSSSFSVVTWMILHVTAPLCPECHLILWRHQHAQSCRVWVFASKSFVSSQTHKTLKWCIHKALKFKSRQGSPIKFVSKNCSRTSIYRLRHPRKHTVPVIFFLPWELWNENGKQITSNLPYILESNPHPFYSCRGLKNQMWIRIACGLDSRSWAGFWKNDRAAVRAVRTIQ